MKAKNLIYSIAGLLLIVGLIICGITFAMSGFNIKGLSNEEQLTMKNYDADKDVTSIHVNDSNKKITVTESEDNNVHVTYYDNSKNHYTIATDSSGTLSIKYSEKRQWYEHIGINFSIDSPSLSIAVPKGLINLDFKNSNGSINVSNIECASIITQNSNGSITLEGINATNNITAKNNNGRITLSNITTKEDIDLETSNSKINTETASADKIYMKNSNGAIYLDNIDVATDINCKTSNSSITGNVNGKIDDFSITSKTSNSSNNLPEETKGGAKKMEMKNSNGKIDINFK